MQRNLLFSLLLAALLPACSPTEGLRLTPAGTGPMVTVDWDAEPLPELPFPNDLATRPDPSSPTGLRLNISLVADTHDQSETRRKLNTLSGWGVFQPITVGFEAPLDLDDLYARHAGDDRLGPEGRADDAVFLIDVTRDSPDYGEIIPLDMGEGRYPMDVWDPDYYFPNDARAGDPSITYETRHEDRNCNGELDPGEDTDGDGNLDIPNVYPFVTCEDYFASLPDSEESIEAAHADAFDDLLSWYERETNTLIVRPTSPLREKTTYAVVVTERVTGVDGQPVRSPWQHVHHLRQADALRPLEEILPTHGLSVDEVAFAWAYTTQDATTELLRVKQGLLGEGPFDWLAEEYPPVIADVGKWNDGDDRPEHWILASELTGILAGAGLFESDGVEVQNFDAFSGKLVGGSFLSPNFLVDKDDDGRDDSEEYWVIDAEAGTAELAPIRVTFSCMLPNEEVFEPPFPVAMWGHGYGSNRVEFASFAWAINRAGLALCSFDFPGHGLEDSASELELAQQLLDVRGLAPTIDHLLDNRARDLNNDGDPDSGGDQWSADAFHTRDQVRQAVVDWMQFVRVLQNCGTGTMPLPNGGDAVACDWNDDGEADIGGPGVKLYGAGGSLGGINGLVAAPLMPELQVMAPAVGGGGLLDIALRSDTGGAVEAMAGRLMTPFFYGQPEDGGYGIYQIVNSVTKMRSLKVATVPELPEGGRIIVENLEHGLVREGWIPADGRFRVGVAADGLHASDKKHLAGIPDDGPAEGQEYVVPDNEGLGDELRVTILDADGAELAVLDTWQGDVVHEGITMKAGSPLVAGSYGSGYIRATPDVRRVAMVFSAILEPGDPIAYARYTLAEPFEELGGRPANLLHMPNVGDNVVSVSTGINQARALGLIDVDEHDERYGTSVDRWLIDRQVVRGIEERGPWTCSWDGQPDPVPCLFDPDDLDEGVDPFNEPSDEPLRITVETSSGVSGMRMVYPGIGGGHSPGLPDPDKPFDSGTFMVGMITSYAVLDGQQIPQDPCIEDLSCDWFAPLPESN